MAINKDLEAIKSSIEGIWEFKCGYPIKFASAPLLMAINKDLEAVK